MNDFHPLVSIVIPVYNGSNFMRSAIDSALGQDYDNIEVIVVNDGSTDTTGDIAKSYGNKIKYFFKENGGVSTALNMAIQKAGGEYISWLSHDDYYFRNKISRQIEELRKIPERDKIIPYCNAEIIDLMNNEKTSRVPLNVTYDITRYDSLKALFAWSIHGCALLISIKAFYNAGFFNPWLRTTQDYQLWFDFIKAGYKFYYIPEILLSMRRHIEQHSNNKTPSEKKESDILWKNAKKIFHKDINGAVSKEDKRIFNSHNPKKFSFIGLVGKIIPKKIKCSIKKWIKNEI